MSTFETTRTNDEAFEKIYGELPHDVDSILNYQEARQHFYVGWQAATAEADKRIAELKANTSQIVQAVSRAADAREAGMENEIIALQAHINVLREALVLAEHYVHTNVCLLQKVREVLAATPEQSLSTKIFDMNVTLSCGCKSDQLGFPSEWDGETRECEPCTNYGMLCMNHFYEWEARPSQYTSNNEVIENCVKVVESFKEADPYTGEVFTSDVNDILNECIEAIKEPKGGKL